MPLPPVTGLQVTAFVGHSITLQWDASIHGNAYKVVVYYENRTSSTHDTNEPNWSADLKSPHVRIEVVCISIDGIHSLACEAPHLSELDSITRNVESGHVSLSPSPGPNTPRPPVEMDDDAPSGSDTSNEAKQFIAHQDVQDHGAGDESDNTDNTDLAYNPNDYDDHESDASDSDVLVESDLEVGHDQTMKSQEKKPAWEVTIHLYFASIPER